MCLVRRFTTRDFRYGVGSPHSATLYVTITAYSHRNSLKIVPFQVEVIAINIGWLVTW